MRTKGGRPPLGVRSVNVKLADSDIELLRHYGDGNLSAGIRRLAREQRARIRRYSAQEGAKG
jgi:hypothetical protein